jgi:hypothetical protein
MIFLQLSGRLECVKTIRDTVTLDNMKLKIVAVINTQADILNN